MAAMLSIVYIPMKTNKRPNGTRMRRNMKNSRSGTNPPKRRRRRPVDIGNSRKWKRMY